MVRPSTLGKVCEILQEAGTLSEADLKEVMVKYSTQEKRVLLARREMARRASGQRRVSYHVGEMELIASFRFERADQPGQELDEDCITETVAQALEMPFEIPDSLQVDYQLVTDTFRGPFAERHMVLPLRADQEAGFLDIAVADPFDVEIMDQVQRFTKARVRFVLCPKHRIFNIILGYHGFRQSMDKAAAERTAEGSDIGNLEQLWKMKGLDALDSDDRPVVQAVWYLFHYAFDQRASDIHIEPRREHSVVRMRIDGVLHKIHVMPHVVHPAVVSRIKTLARMDIAERRRPQDGRLKTAFGETEIELRVSTIPTAFGEKVVIRIFDPEVILKDLSALGFFPEVQRTYEDFIHRPNGLVLLTGPTGSGKTTTLYSSLTEVQDAHINITTIEDPIEMVYEPFNQMAIQPKIGFDYAAALRHVLRQDPDVIMVGEMRDPATAQLACQAALTGHLVLTTVHTNDAPSALQRVLDLEVLPYLLATTLVGVVAQRLVRVVCDNCAVRQALDRSDLLALGIRGAEKRQLKVRVGDGCVSCRGTGYRGRTGVFEVMPINERIREMILEREPSDSIRREARFEGMLTLREYAIMHLARGATTVEEVLRVTTE
jgi:general secretion pathway protein E